MRIEDEGKEVSSYWMTLRKRQVMVLERGSTRSHSVENSLCKRLRTCREADWGMNE
jgi:hypothetical protein